MIDYSKPIREIAPTRTAPPTASARRYVAEAARIGNFEVYFVNASIQLIEHLPDVITQIQRRRQARGDRIDQPLALDPKLHEALLDQLFLTRHIENYLVYLVELLKEIFLARPETLRSAQQERLDFILQFSTMEELTRAIAEKKVEELSFLSMKDLEAFFTERLGLQLFGDDDQRRIIIEGNEVRNIVVHNRGRISPIFKRRLPDFPGNVGDQVHVSESYVRTLDHALSISVQQLDEHAVAKFPLQTVTT